MSIEVLLLADVKDVGTEGAVVNVKEGFARNYLFPKKLAATVTDATRRRLEKIRKTREAARQAETEAAKALAERIAKASFTVAVKTGEGDKMFGSVTTADIASLLKAQGFEVDKSAVVLDEPIRKLGVYDIQLKLASEVSATMKVWIVEE